MLIRTISDENLIKRVKSTAVETFVGRLSHQQIGTSRLILVITLLTILQTKCLTEVGPEGNTEEIRAKEDCRASVIIKIKDNPGIGLPSEDRTVVEVKEAVEQAMAFEGLVATGKTKL